MGLWVFWYVGVLVYGVCDWGFFSWTGFVCGNVLKEDFEGNGFVLQQFLSNFGGEKYLQGVGMGVRRCVRGLRAGRQQTGHDGGREGRILD